MKWALLARLCIVVPGIALGREVAQAAPIQPPNVGKIAVSGPVLISDAAEEPSGRRLVLNIIVESRWEISDFTSDALRPIVWSDYVSIYPNYRDFGEAIIFNGSQRQLEIKNQSYTSPIISKMKLNENPTSVMSLVTVAPKGSEERKYVRTLQAYQSAFGYVGRTLGGRDRFRHVAGLLGSEVSQISGRTMKAGGGNVQSSRVENEQPREKRQNYISAFYFIKEALPPIVLFAASVFGVISGASIVVRGDAQAGWHRFGLWGLGSFLCFGSIAGLLAGWRFLGHLSRQGVI